MERFQKIALAALISVLFLIFVGAVVRATGSGLGCPDWPRCWGSLVPPRHAEQIDFEKIDLEKFREKAARHGRDPESVTVEALKAEFNPMHTWIEYINRLCATPVGILSLATFIAAFWQISKRPAVWLASAASLFLVLFNAWLGMRVVLSGLQPGIITLHMALAILLVCLLVFAAWRGTDRPWRNTLGGEAGWGWWGGGLAVFLLVVAESVLGAQVRELTDEFAKSYGSAARSEWTDKLEHSALYLVHRSFSWLIVLGTLVVFVIIPRRRSAERIGRLEKCICILVFALMLMGIVLAWVGVLRVVQVLHVGAASLLIAALFFWLLATRPVRA